VMEFHYIDDVLEEFTAAIEGRVVPREGFYGQVSRRFEICLQDLAETLLRFRDYRAQCMVPDIGDPFVRYLYSTYLSYVPQDRLAVAVQERRDERGRLYEVVKSPRFGQIFLSETRPGVTRGNHFHHTKAEKFCVISGEGVVRIRDVATGESKQFPVSGEEVEVIDIPPGCTHNLTNTGSDVMITMFWANEIFDPDNPDTYFEEV
jgi:UDP-2-acetamido-2,6-beta-L-arabino-hexul-4-ose reductase